MLLFLALNFKHQHGPRGSRVWPLHASDSLCLSGPCIFPGTVSRTERKKAQSPQHQLSNGVLEALTKQQQEASFFFLVLLSQSHTLSLSLTHLLFVCLPTWARGCCVIVLQSHLLFIKLVSYPAFSKLKFVKVQATHDFKKLSYNQATHCS